MSTQERHSPKITVMSYWFSANKMLRSEILSLFPNVTFQERPQRRSTNELVDHLQNSPGMVLGADDMNAEVLRHLPNLEIISVFGAGVDNLDVEFARSQGIKIGCSPGVNKVSVAEQTVALMIGLCRKLFFNHMALKQGEWREEDGGWDLSGKTVGIVGCGETGTETLRLLRPFGCTVLLCDVQDVSQMAAEFGARQVNLDDLLAQADIVSLHVPLEDATRHLVSHDQLKLMKYSAYLINISRGAVVDQSALEHALRNNIIAGAALDVFDPEPPTEKSFLALPNLVLTPHTGGGSYDAILAMGRAAIALLADHFIHGENNDKKTAGRPPQGRPVLY